MAAALPLPISEKQHDYLVNSDAFVNLAEGSVRAGKSMSGLLRWLKHVAEAPKRGDLIVCAKTFDTAARNIFNPLREVEVFGPLARSVRYTRGAPTAKILGRTVEIITFANIEAEERLRGLTSCGAYVDEWSLMGEEFHEQLIARCSTDGAQIFGNTNPDNPSHWLKGKIDDGRAPDWKTWKFTIDDNPTLSEAKKDQWRRMYTGLWYKRMILGLWVMSEGAIYETWDPDIDVVKTLPRIVRWISLGVDYGTVNPFAGLVLGLGADGLLYLTREWRWDSKRRMRQLTDVEYSQRLRSWISDDLKITPEWWCVDPSAASFRRQLAVDGVTAALADNNVVDGLRRVASLFALRALKVHESCEGLISEIPGYVWDVEKSKKGEDAPVKEADHSCDAMRYAIKTTEVTWGGSLRRDLRLAA